MVLKKIQLEEHVLTNSVIWATGQLYVRQGANYGGARGVSAPLNEA